MSLRRKINIQELQPDVATLQSRVPPTIPVSEDEKPPIPILDNASEDSKGKSEDKTDAVNSVINQPGAAHPIQLQSVHWEVPTLWNLLISPNGTQV